MNIFIIGLLGCTNPEPIALTACKAVPGLYVDAAGMALLKPVLASEELAILKKAKPTRGHEVVGDAGLATIRSKTTCTVDSVHGAGAGQWAVTLTRRLPSVHPDGTIGDIIEQKLEWQVVKKDGGRVQTGLGVTHNMRLSIDEAIKQKDLVRVTASWRAIAKKSHDPVLAVDIAEAEAKESAWFYRKNVVGLISKIKRDKMVFEVENRGKSNITSAVVTAIFEVSGTTIPIPVTVPALEAGNKTTLTVPIPDGAEGSVKLETTGVVL